MNVVPMRRPIPNDLAPSGCRSPRTASSRRRRACSPAPRACTTPRDDGRQVLDGTAGLWCVNAGHCRPKIAEAIARAGRASSTTRRPSRWGTRRRFELANRAGGIAPEGLDHVFFTNSGSEAVETALKIALAYQRGKRRGLAHPADRPRARLSRGQFRRHLGRRHRRATARCSARCSPASTTCRTRTTSRATPSRRGQPEHGAELADELERHRGAA